MSWEYTKHEARCASCGRTGVRIMGSNDWRHQFQPENFTGCSEVGGSVQFAIRRVLYDTAKQLSVQTHTMTRTHWPNLVKNGDVIKSFSK
jgi:hypothetical protein